MSLIDSALPVKLQSRDMQLLRGLFECRVMTLEHASAFYFDGKDEAAKKRLQKLKAAGLIAERPRKAFDPSILYLTVEGLRPLKEVGILAEYPEFDLPALERRAKVSALTLSHELEVIDVRTAFYAAARHRAGVSIAEFSTWPVLNQFTTVKASGAEFCVKPDGFVRIHEKEADGGVSEHSFFVEVDRSTETQDLLAARAASYRAYYSSGGFAERNGAPRSAFQEYPFRVLMVFKTPERRNNTAERLLAANPPIFTHAWLSTVDEVRNDPFGSIWIRPVDYRDAIGGFLREDVSIGQRGYQRNTGRDILVDERVKRCRLLD